MMSLPRLVLAGFVLVTMAASVQAQSADEKTAVRDSIWAKEQKIYANRANGNLEYYIANTSANYVGWPPSAARPVALTGLKQDSKRMVGLTKEKLTMEMTDFTLSGDTAVIYYLNHRTVRPDGTAVDEKFENIHVWTKEGTDWRLVGAMSRLQPKRP
jgi:hypothetical protein